MPGVRDRNRKTHVGVFTGEEFQLRKIPVSDFIQYFGALPAEQSDTLANQLKAIGDKIVEQASRGEDSAKEMQRFWLERGVVSPKVFFGPYDECPEDQIHVDDLSDDASGLIGAISEFSFDFSGFKKKMEDILRRQQPDTAGPGGDEVREAANGGPPAGDGQ